MQFKSLLTIAPMLFAAVSAAPAKENFKGLQCGTTQPKNATREAHIKTLVESKKALGVQRAQASSVSVYFHVTTDGSTGSLSDSDISGQISALNSAYSDYGFSFSLAGSDTTENANWFHNSGSGSSTANQMKASLRKGGAGDLNVYSVLFSDNLLGFATFPWDYSSNPDIDGIVFRYTTVPGGSETGYEHGITLVHETGHWLGLYHTFQDGCTGGDEVADTPAEAEPSYECTPRDSCPSSAGSDPIHNYMDYTMDNCKTGFTSGQATRMASVVSEYRGL